MSHRRTALAQAWPLDDRMNVVLFAGMGGACDGLEEAGFPVHLAINHNEIAIAVHQHRHPHTRHLQTDVFEVEVRPTIGTRRLGILWGSPDCRHFSNAKGRAPVSKRVRSLPWVICRWAGQGQPEIIGLENVPEIKTWGPLIARRDPATGRVIKLDGTVAGKGERVRVWDQQLVPDPKRKGKTWLAFKRHLHGLGYSFETRTLVCADFNDIATIRKREWGIGHRDGSPVLWPERTNAPRSKAAALGLRPWVGAWTIIDWSLPSKSIFGRPKDLARATLRRLAVGTMRWVVNAAEPFLVQMGYGEREGQAPRVLNIEEPLGTLVQTPKHALVSPHITVFHGGAQGVDIENPMPTVTGNSYRKRPGGAIPLGIASARLEPLEGRPEQVAAFLAQHNNHGKGDGNQGRSLEEPLSTITVSGAQQGVVAVHISTLRGTNKAGRSIEDPLPALTSGGLHQALATAAFIETYYSSGGQDQDIADPLGTLTTKARHGVVTVQVKGVTHVLVDILLRMLSPEEGARAQGFKDGCLPDWITVKGEKRRLTKTQKYSLVGNSCPPEMVRLLISLNARRSLSMEAAD